MALSAGDGMNIAVGVVGVIVGYTVENLFGKLALDVVGVTDSGEVGGITARGNDIAPLVVVVVQRKPGQIIGSGGIGDAVDPGGGIAIGILFVGKEHEAQKGQFSYPVIYKHR